VQVGEVMGKPSIREAELDVLATMYDAVTAMTEATTHVRIAVERINEQVAALYREHAELRDDMLALSNRIEALTRRSA
jgi:hypothetical protein